MNVILVVIDALRARNLGCYGYEKDTSPNINSLAREGSKFNNCFSCANCTDPSVTTILSGRHPLHHGVMNHGPEHFVKNRKKIRMTGTKFLPEILDKRSKAVDFLNLLEGSFDESGMERPWWQKLRSWFGQKIEGTFLYKPILKTYGKLFGVSKSGINPEVTYQKAKKFIEEAKSDFFLFVHDWSVHGPYNPPPEYREMFTYEGGDELLEEVAGSTPLSKMRMLTDVKTVKDGWAFYDASIRWSDRELGKFIEWLKEEGLWNETLFVVTADHGESLGKRPPLYFIHGGFYDETVHVPLIMHHSDLPHKEVDALVSLTDITPTIMNFLSKSTFEMDGRSLLPVLRGEADGHNAVYSAVENMRMVRTEDFKLIKVPDPERLRKEKYWYNKDGMELYDLEDDPDESENIINDRPEKLLEMEKMLEEKEKKLKTLREKDKIKTKIDKYATKKED